MFVYLFPIKYVFLNIHFGGKRGHKVMYCYFIVLLGYFSNYDCGKRGQNGLSPYAAP